jgi:hypothetical protein
MSDISVNVKLAPNEDPTKLLRLSSTLTQERTVRKAASSASLLDVDLANPFLLANNLDLIV